jgi:hypothetical protein
LSGDTRRRAGAVGELVEFQRWLQLEAGVRVVIPDQLLEAIAAVGGNGRKETGRRRVGRSLGERAQGAESGGRHTQHYLGQDRELARLTAINPRGPARLSPSRTAASPGVSLSARSVDGSAAMAARPSGTTI